MSQYVYAFIQRYLLYFRSAHGWRVCSGGLLLIGALLTTPAAAQITGTVYRDFNADGIRSYTAAAPLAGEIGVGGVTVTAYTANNVVVGTTTTSSATATQGQFSLTPSAAGPYRVQFSNLPSGYFAGPKGAQSGTAVQFVNATTLPVSATLNFGINYPADYCQANPNLIVPCYVNGNPTDSTGTAGGRNVLVSLAYNSTGNSPAEATLAINSQIGTVYGVAYHRAARYIYTGAFVKSHSGLGPGGAGAIYLTRPGSGNTTTSSVFTTLPMAVTVASNTARGLPGSVSTANSDASVFDLVGKTGLGDIELSDDGTQLYAVNLSDRKLYQITLANPTTTPSVSSTAVFTIPSPTQKTGSVFRPFALKYYRGRVYVGGVTTNEAVTGTTTFTASSGVTSITVPDTTGMKGVVYEFNPTGGTFTQVLSFPLTYRKGADNSDKTGLDRAEYWYPWTATQTFVRNDDSQSYPQPILAGIEFDVDGAMIIGIRDRFGEQYGNQNYGPNAGDATLYRAISPGDILRAGRCAAGVNQWSLEGNARTCGGAPTAGADNSQGPSGGEYYWGDQVAAGANHLESAQGGLALYPGQGEVASTAADPTDVFDTGGIKRFNNADGSASAATSVQVYDASDVSTFGKGNGLGDLELNCNPEPIEIGNRVWNDGLATTSNGIQDPGEANAPAGITVFLYQNGGLVASTVTDGNGEYYFNNANVTGGLLPNTAYEIRIPQSQTILNGYTPVAAGAGSDPNINSDGVTVGPNVVISLTTGNYGEINHNYDFGFTSCPTLTATPGSVTACGTVTGSLSVTTTATGTNAVQFVSFTSPQSGTAIYTGGTVLGTATPTGGTATLTNVTLTNSSGSPVTYYVYARLSAGSAGCQPAQLVATVAVNSVQSLSLTSGTLCNGQGYVTLYATPGFASYAFSPGLTQVNGGTPQSSYVALATTAGVYSVTATAVTGCASTVVASATVVAGTVPVANATSSGTITCATSATLSGSSSVTGSTYSWTGPNSFASTAQTFSAVMPGTYTLTVMANGCSSNPVSVTPAVNTTSPAVTLSSATVCVGQSATLTATARLSSYAFSSGLTQIGGSSGNTATATTAGTYSVTATGANSCTATAQGTVTVTPLPAATATVSGTVTCAASATVSGSSTLAGSTYAWSGPNGFTSTQQSFTTSTPGPYSLTVTANGCSSVNSATAIVTQNTAPPQNVSLAVSQGLSCTATTATLTAGSTTGVSYAFAGPGIVSTGANSATVNAAGVYSVTVTAPNGCTATTQTTVTQAVTPPQNVTATNTGPLSCTNTSVTVSAATSTSGVSYRWSGPGSFASTAQSFATSTAGTYSVTLTAPNGCTALASTIVSQTVASVTVVQGSCNNNNTNSTTADDYYLISVRATAGVAGPTGRYYVVLNANPDGTGGTILNAGGTAYGGSVTVGSAGTFRADGSSTYALTIRDLDIPICLTNVTTVPIASCSSCLPGLCPKQTITKR